MYLFCDENENLSNVTVLKSRLCTFDRYRLYSMNYLLPEMATALDRPLEKRPHSSQCTWLCRWVCTRLLAEHQHIWESSPQMFWVPLHQTGGRSWLHTVHDEKIYLGTKLGGIHNLLTLKENVNDFYTEELSMQQCLKYLGLNSWKQKCFILAL